VSLGVPGFWSFQGRKRWLQGAEDTESYRIREIREMGTQDRVDEAGIVESCVSLGEGKEVSSVPESLRRKQETWENRIPRTNRLCSISQIFDCMKPAWCPAA
jgi:hypothetical protein